VENVAKIYWREHFLNVDKKELIEFNPIKVSPETHPRLAILGTVGQTFEDVIKSLLDEHDEREKSNVKSKK
jgi:hypothetical protein